MVSIAVLIVIVAIILIFNVLEEQEFSRFIEVLRSDFSNQLPLLNPARNFSKSKGKVYYSYNNSTVPKLFWYRKIKNLTVEELKPGDHVIYKSLENNRHYLLTYVGDGLGYYDEYNREIKINNNNLIAIVYD